MTISDKHARYDYSHIRLRLVRLLDAEDQWRGFFGAIGAKVAHCLYEDLMESPQATSTAFPRRSGSASPH